MQNHIFACAGRRIELWTHPEPDHLAASIRHNRGFYEADVLAKCREIHLPGTAVVDVGANIGNHTVFFAAILGARVHAFEPFGPSFDLLELNIAANGLEGLVTASRLGIGACDGTGALRPGPSGNVGTTRVAFGLGDLPVRSLDSLAIPEPIGLMKVDVEGAEVAVLRGAAGLIETWLPDIVVEAGDAPAFRAVAEVLLGFGYVPRGRYASTPTYLFSAMEQGRRMERVLAGA